MFIKNKSGKHTNIFYISQVYQTGNDVIFESSKGQLGDIIEHYETENEAKTRYSEVEKELVGGNMFVKLKSGHLLNLFFVDDCIVDPHNETKVIIYQVNGVSIVEQFDNASDASSFVDKVLNSTPSSSGVSGGSGGTTGDAKIKYKIVSELPETGEEGVFYLLKIEDGSENNLYEEFIYVEGKPESLGTRTVDLSDYYKKEEMDEKLTWLEY